MFKGCSSKKEVAKTSQDGEESAKRVWTLNRESQEDFHGGIDKRGANHVSFLWGASARWKRVNVWYEESVLIVTLQAMI